jgi:hypothetical protein
MKGVFEFEPSRSGVFGAEIVMGVLILTKVPLESQYFPPRMRTPAQ